MNSLLMLTLPVLASLSTAQEASWPQFLGPNGDPSVESTVPSLDFDLERDLRWKIELPKGSSSPCIVGNRIFLTGSVEDEMVMLAIERSTGKELWRRTRKTPTQEKWLHVDADSAAPTACTDGERVAFYFGSFGLIVLDMQGELLWEKAMPIPAAPFGVGTSPILIGDSLILSRDGCADSGIYAFDKRTGEELWDLPRLGFTYSFGTPFLWENSERTELVVAGTQRLTGLDPKSGKELWQIGGLTSFVCTTPTADKDTLYFAAWSTSDAAPDERFDATWGDLEFTAEELADGQVIFDRLDLNQDGKLEMDEFPESRARDAFEYLDKNGDGVVVATELVPGVTMPKGSGNNIMVAVKAGGNGDIKESHVAWSVRRGIPYVASPLLHEGRIYLAKAGGLITCLNPENGKNHFGRERLEDRSEYYATPVGVAGHVILCSSAGTLFVLRASDEFEVLRKVDLGDPIHATPAVVDGKIYVRSQSALWAFGQAE